MKATRLYISKVRGKKRPMIVPLMWRIGMDPFKVFSETMARLKTKPSPNFMAEFKRIREELNKI